MIYKNTLFLLVGMCLGMGCPLMAEAQSMGQSSAKNIDVTGTNKSQTQTTKIRKPHSENITFSDDDLSADFNNDCVLDIDDVHLFLNLYAQNDPSVMSLAAPYDEATFFDVDVFLHLFDTGLTDDQQQMCGVPGLVPCSGFEDVYVYPVSTYSGARVCPAPDTRVLYVSSEDGDDANDGLTPQTAFASTSKAVEIARNTDGINDWILLKRNNIWQEQALAHFRLSRTNQTGGPDAENPLVITAYGEGTTRPLIHLIGSSAFRVWGDDNSDEGNITVSGVHVKSSPGTGGLGFDLLGRSKNVVIEDSVFEGHSVNRIQQDNVNLPINNVLIKDTLIYDNASDPGPGGHSQGLFASGVQGLKIQDSFLDRNGWAGSRDIGLNPEFIASCGFYNVENNLVEIPVFYPYDGSGYLNNCNITINTIPDDEGGIADCGYEHEGSFVSVKAYEYLDDGDDNSNNDPIGSCPETIVEIHAGTEHATIFNHNLYLQYGGFPAVIEGNLISRASSHGTQARSGAYIRDNIYSRNPLNAFIAGGAISSNFTSEMIDNVVLEGNDINSSTPRGMGFSHNNAYASTISGNVIANMYDGISEHNNKALHVGCGVGDYVTDACRPTISDNVIYNWTDANGEGAAMEIQMDRSKVEYELLVRSNIFVKSRINNANGMIVFRSDRDSIIDAGEDVSFADSVYVYPEIFNTGNNGGRFDLGGGEGWINFNEWQLTYENDAQGYVEAGFDDPCRTLVTYYDDVILGNDSNDNCAIMHDDVLYDDFMQYIRVNKNRLTPNENLETVNILDYIREGFGKDEIDVIQE